MKRDIFWGALILFTILCAIVLWKWWGDYPYSFSLVKAEETPIVLTHNKKTGETHLLFLGKKIKAQGVWNPYSGHLDVPYTQRWSREAPPNMDSLK